MPGCRIESARGTRSERQALTSAPDRGRARHPPRPLAVWRPYRCLRLFLFFAELEVQPTPRLRPIPLHRPRRYPQHFRCFLLGQAGEVTALHDLAEPLVVTGQTFQSLIESQE